MAWLCVTTSYIIQCYTYDVSQEACVSGMAGTRLPYQMNMAVLAHSSLALLVLAQAVSLRNPLLVGV